MSHDPFEFVMLMKFNLKDGSEDVEYMVKFDFEPEFYGTYDEPGYPASVEYEIFDVYGNLVDEDKIQPRRLKSIGHVYDDTVYNMILEAAGEEIDKRDITFAEPDEFLGGEGDSDEHRLFEEWYAERQGQFGEPPFSCSHDAAQAAWQAAQEQPAAPAVQIKGRTCVTCGHLKVWDVKQAVPRARLSDEQIETIADQDEDDSRCPTCGEDGGTSCGMPNCGFITGGGTEPSEQPAAPDDDLLLLAIQRLNSNPYSLMKHECIAVISELRDEQRKATPRAPAGLRELSTAELHIVFLETERALHDDDWEWAKDFARRVIEVAVSKGEA